MSVFGEELVERLPLSSSLHDKGNPMRKILVDGVGEWLDSFDSDYLGEEVFLDSATGSYLDLWGKDYNVPRKPNESDSVYRERIVYETVGHLTTNYLKDVYGVELYNYISGFTLENNVLVSDNIHISGKKIGVTTDEVMKILNKRFVINNSVSWLVNGRVDSIINLSDEEVIGAYDEIYYLENLGRYFEEDLFGEHYLKSVLLHLPNAINCQGMFFKCVGLVSAELYLPNATNCVGLFNACNGLESVDLSLPNATNCTNLFNACDGLESVDLSLPNATNCTTMLRHCDILKNVTLNLPKLITYTNIFKESPELETIDLIIPETLVSGMVTYIQSLELQNLTSLKINGVEYID